MGTFSAEEGDYLFLPVPSDGNVLVTVNGEEVQTETIWDCFLAVPLTEGENEVRVSAFSIRDENWTLAGCLWLGCTRFADASSAERLSAYPSFCGASRKGSIFHTLCGCFSRRLCCPCGDLFTEIKSEF